MTYSNEILAFFRAFRPHWENSITWDDEDMNADAIDARAERLTDEALDEEAFSDVPVTEIKDLAVDFVCKH